MTGWYVACVLYVLGALWVPIAMGVASPSGMWGYPGESFWRRYVLPIFFVVVWPLALGVALIELYMNSRKPGGRKR